MNESRASGRAISFGKSKISLIEVEGAFAPMNDPRAFRNRCPILNESSRETNYLSRHLTTDN